ncbi:heme peroxidase [Mycolicibacterium smegmatis]|uniref:Heme peroxidase superfamily protein n=2 Tax=Mycolicibacterium smegmatis TaxID=1772 RepID=A0QX13_MYCS2|nr:heme peroxidase [Mycolicibacterium smegmatis]ABK75172.1 heme peroxidase superfamily protein [Mycolicibacterium smegmatis MC2 155]AIU08289.1 heme peroxidase [Mycolicibacterium smegmatis MC2 155]AIU14914.1 heme peroxidase [Mycolicibacterium smegmatis]AIU21537.1 heme peroxidase [Mycolicibacterium smegmatis]MBE9616740.1 heme peroxidase [Mycolicibacterium smegmatis]
MQRITEPDLETETETDAARLRAACERDLGDPARWFPPPGYPDSLALCIVDAIFSSGARHSMTEKVIGRYREHRRALGGDPDRDGAVELLGTFADVGGAQQWASQIGNRRPTSTAPDAPLRAAAVADAAEALVAMGISTADDLRSAAGAEQLEPVRTAWCGVPGQRSGVTWSNLLKLAGLPASAAGRLVVGYVTRELGPASPERVGDLIREVADLAGWDAGRLDHAIWRHEAGLRCQQAG